jgi:hypothetical protein
VDVVGAEAVPRRCCRSFAICSREIITILPLRRLGFKKMLPDPHAVSKSPVRLQVAPVAFFKTHR